MSDQPKALRLADALDNLYVYGVKGDAAIELRRLHKVEAERNALKAALAEEKRQHCLSLNDAHKVCDQVESERDAAVKALKHASELLMNGCDKLALNVLKAAIFSAARGET